MAHHIASGSSVQAPYRVPTDSSDESDHFRASCKTTQTPATAAHFTCKRLNLLVPQPEAGHFAAAPHFELAARLARNHFKHYSQARHGITKPDIACFKLSRWSICQGRFHSDCNNAFRKSCSKLISE